jgi:hypothetical protein
VTEQEWLVCTDPSPMLRLLRGKVSDRKFRLFAVGCCRRIPSYVSDQWRKYEIEVAERLADGLASDVDGPARSADRRPAVLNGVSAIHAPQCGSAGSASAASVAAAWVAFSVEGITNSAWHQVYDREREDQIRLLHDVFANPFHGVSADDVYLTPTVTSLATAAYEVRILPSGQLDPQRLAVLADAVEESGCDNVDMLMHLRSPGLHVRGCWVVDLLLAKE